MGVVVGGDVDGKLDDETIFEVGISVVSTIGLEVIFVGSADCIANTETEGDATVMTLWV